MGEGNIANTFLGGFTTKQSGASHITVDGNPGNTTHISTPVPGLGQGGDVTIHTPVDGSGNVGESSGSFRGP